MPEQIKVLKRFPYRGAHHGPGDVISVHPKFAKLIVRIGKAKYHKEPAPKAGPHKAVESPPRAPAQKDFMPEEKTPPAPKRTYNRRNMTVQNTDPDKKPESGSVNTYKTADQKAE